MTPSRGVFVALVLLAAVAARGQETGTRPASKTPGANGAIAAASRGAVDTVTAQLAAIDKDYREAQSAWSARYQAETRPDALQTLSDERPKAAAWLARVKRVAQAHGADPAVAECHAWLVEHNIEGAERESALNALARDYPTSPVLKSVCSSLESSLSASDEAFLRVATESPLHDVKGQALFSLARKLTRTASIARNLREERDAKSLAFLQNACGKETVARLATVDSAKLDAEADGLMQRVVKDFSQVPGSRKQTLGDLASRVLYETHELAVGKPAPEISAEGVDGQPLKLSAFRGKVVMLDFWGNW